MIDYGIYEIQKDEETNKFYINEQLGGRSIICDNIEDVAKYIERDLKNI